MQPIDLWVKQPPSRPAHWYLIHIEECPVCGRYRETRVRQYTPRPTDARERHTYEQYYDHCDIDYREG